jgi:glutamate carboxypeptidase
MTSRLSVARELLQDLKRRLPGMVDLLGDFVSIESPSHDKVAVDAMGERVAEEWRQRGARVTTLAQKVRGNHVRAELIAEKGHRLRPILVLGHLDTVYPKNTLRRMPLRVARGRTFGPGTFDMKGGLVIALFAVDALRALKFPLRRNLIFLWTSDEEIGSQSSRRIIERQARKCEAVFVLEPALGKGGSLKTQRKGVGEVQILVTGRAAHAGINPQDGLNAVHELAFQIARLAEFNDPAHGITVQANIIEGGSATNVVAEKASARIDVRFTHAADARPLVKKLVGLRPVLKGTRIEVSGGLDRPPLERTAAIGELFEKARELAGHMGFALEEAATGGGSDGNFTAALGVPTLDGLGAVGDKAHGSGEYVVNRALPERAALLAGLMCTL